MLIRCNIEPKGEYKSDYDEGIEQIKAVLQKYNPNDYEKIMCELEKPLLNLWKLGFDNGYDNAW